MAAGSTYTPIATNTLGSNQASVTFSSISGSYTDLVLVANFALTVNDTLLMRVGNGSADTGSNYSDTVLYGNGTSAVSQRDPNKTFFYMIEAGNAGQTALNTMTTVNFMNYANTTTYKTCLFRGNSTSPTSFPSVEAQVGLWRSTSAINYIYLYANSGNILSGSTFTLYGIKSA
jgi:hypothetical protein